MNESNYIIITIIFRHLIFIGPLAIIYRCLRNNLYTRTRKIMNYTWISQSRKKFWWRVSEQCWRANRLLDLCIEAKDSSNYLVAGSIRNFSQESKWHI